mgnify:CR=1 FL=1
MLASVPSLERWWHFAGAFHPLAVHLPIGLIVAALVFEFCRRRRGKRTPGVAATACLALGAFGAMVAAATGWSHAETAEYASEAVFWHRWMGIAAAGLSVLALIACAVAWWRKGRLTLNWHRFVLVVTVTVLGIAGHLGGTLVHGDYFQRAWDRLFAEPGPQYLPVAGGAVVDLQQQALAILGRNCVRCHAADEPSAGLSLTAREAMLQGGRSGEAAVVPGRAADSLLIHLVRGDDPDRIMPPKGARLTGEEIDVLAAWIDAGAPWGEQAREHWHWAYRAPIRPNLPAVKDTHWPRNAIDYFVLARIEAAGLSPNTPADRATLLRRVTLDLTGLPPEPAAVDRFLADQRPDAYERVVDALLESPAYGERMASRWLDLARYADTHGYEKDGRRQIWAYRDWVIHAFNEDMPYDRFTIQQIAGDLIPRASLLTRIASGFNRNTMINEEGGTDQEEFRVEAVIDRVNTVGAVWLGSTFGCAQCHDHKNDPISQQEYFELFAFFNNDIMEVKRLSSTEARAEGGMMDVPFMHDWDRYQAVLEQLAQARAEVERVQAQSPGDAILIDAARARVDELEKERKSLVAGTTLVMERAAEPRVTHVFNKGSFLDPGKRVAADVPAVLPPMNTPPSQRDRLALARWIADPAHPLTARVAVNRIWELHFGRGVVETSEDFGVQGEPPSHPELLDYLATEFVRQGWSMKQMHRLIVTSAAYRQASYVTPEHLERDPRNVLLARFPRLRVEAEMLRDVALHIGGLLSPRIGGPSVFPPQPPGVWTMIYSSDQWVDSTGEDRFRRGLYTFWRRTAPHPSLTTLDAPSRELVCTRRGRTSSPLQALITLNDPQYFEAAAGLAMRAIAGAGTDAERIAFAFRLCTARLPTQAEAARLQTLLSEQIAVYENDRASAETLLASLGHAGVPTGPNAHLAAWVMLANVLLNLDETMTRG